MDAKPNLEFRSYAEGDEQAIFDLFMSSFGRPVAEAEWRWRFEQAPAGRGIIELAWDGDVLAAHYAVTPVGLSVANRPFLSALSGTTMTHPNYRGLGLFPRLAERCYARMTDSGMACVWGFPNSNSHRGFVQDLHWNDIVEIPSFRCIRESFKSLPEIDASPVDRFDERIDELWARTAPARERAVVVERNSAYMQWRYIQKPSRDYRVLAHGDRVLDGVVVYKQYGNELQIMDLLAESVEAGTRLVQQVMRTAQDQNLASVALWLALSLPQHRALEKLGFRPDAPVTYAGARPLLDELREMIGNPAAWRFSMGDSDVY